MSRSLCLLKTLLTFTLLDLVIRTSSTTLPPSTGIEESKVPDIKGKLSAGPSSKENDVEETPLSLGSTTQEFLKKSGPLTASPLEGINKKETAETNSIPSKNISDSSEETTTTAVPISNFTKASTSTNTHTPNSTYTTSDNITTTPKIPCTTTIMHANSTIKPITPTKSNVTLPEINTIKPSISQNITISSSTNSGGIKESESTPTILPAPVNKTSIPGNTSLTTPANSDNSRNVPAVVSVTTPTSHILLISTRKPPSPTTEHSNAARKIPAEESSRTKVPHLNGTSFSTASTDSANSEESANGLSARALPVAVSSLLLVLVVRTVA